jgi:ubiquinone/menaquinone biosynthesis C-methylase UbiE
LSTKERTESFRYRYPIFAYSIKIDKNIDLQHHLISITLDSALIRAPKGQTPTVLHLAPITTNNRVLDVGTGTGIWAIDFGGLCLRMQCVLG